MGNNQRKVSTKGGGVSPKTRKILKALEMFPEGTTPKTLARETGINVNTVKSILPKIPGIHKPMRGYYKVYSRGDGTPPLNDLVSWNFHNCILSASCPYDLSHSFDWGLVKVVVSAANGRATCRLSSDFPLNVSSLCFVAGFFAEVSGCSFSDVFVSSVEFNKDYSNLRLDGVKCVSISSLMEQFKLYQKDCGLRVEHKTAVPFSMENIVDMLSQNPISTDHLVKLEQQQSQLDRLLIESSKNSQLMFKLIDLLKAGVS